MEKKRGISGSTLKMIAIITMLVDHVASGILGRYIVLEQSLSSVPLSNEWMQEHFALVLTYQIMRWVGRLAFPIFCFLLVEGFVHTSNVKKYAGRLFLFSLISEIPFDLVFSGSLLEFSYQNVFFTLLIGLLVMWGQRIIEEKTQWNSVIRLILSILVIVAGMAAAALLRTDYGAIGVACIVILYVLRKNRKNQLLGGCVSFIWELPAPIAFVPIAFYNGQRGWNIRYFFYLFYPVHLLIIYLICIVLGIGGISVI